MTKEEVINTLNSLKEYYNDKNEDSYVGFDAEDNEAIDMAIKALEQTELNPSYNSIKLELDCISRDDAIELIAGADETDGNEPVFSGKQVIKMLKSLPPATPKTEWIPCSERLPNEFVDVLCNTDSEEIFIATYLGKMNDGADCFDDNNGMMWEGDVIAWMPLPEPFREEDKGEN